MVPISYYHLYKDSLQQLIGSLPSPMQGLFLHVVM